jgi:hypothetical protein
MFQETSLDFKLVQRICLLQQALDQAMDSLDDLQQRVASHQMLESQLAQTEEYANVQQKIIVNLQQQLGAKTQWQQEVLDRLLTGIKNLINDQQIELERLRVRVQQSQAEVQDYLVRLKNHYQHLPTYPQPTTDFELTTEVMVVRAMTVSLSSQLQAAQQHIGQLDRTLTRHQVTFAQMQAQVKAVNGYSEPSSSENEGSLANDTSYLLESAEDPVALQAIVEVQQQKISELGAELYQQFQQQTRIKYRCQELAAERDCLKQREASLRLENELLRKQLQQQQPLDNPPQSQQTYWLPRPKSARSLFRTNRNEH